jgi:hypothetical protein
VITFIASSREAAKWVGAYKISTLSQQKMNVKEGRRYARYISEVETNLINVRTIADIFWALWLNNGPSKDLNPYPICLPKNSRVRERASLAQSSLKSPR